MAPFYRVNGIGDVYVPIQFRDIAPDDAPLKLFTNADLGQLNRIFTHLRRRGVGILSGEWEQIAAVMEYIERKQDELISPSKSSNGKRNAKSSGRRAPARERAEPTSHLMCWADASGILQVNPPPDLPYLFELVGESPGANEGCPFLIPLLTIQKIQNALAETYPIHALGMPLLASANVLPPRSQETIQLFRQGLQSVKSHLSPEATVLDMGCGCGCLSLLAAQELGNSTVQIFASDVLPEAVATTRLNVQRFADIHDGKPQINIMPAGDLFEAVSARCFDLIIFNAPWVVSRARNRAEIGIHDESQRTLRRFFSQFYNHLKAQGRLLIGYADASGTKAVSNLEAMIAEAGLVVVNCFKERVATHRSKRKWEHILVYELVKRTEGL
ncbi:MAG: class I SAM-dependent methyltransferase [Candidatus Poribacteria bacterium]|nr:class I SAM-dependent methyltransferase [Candidatus Poribacteria bacterium]